MTTCTHYSPRPVAVVLAVSLMAGVITLSAHATDGQYSEVSDVSQLRGWGDPAMAEIAVNSGRALVNHLRSAGALLDEGQAAQARSALIASREFAAAIERTMPYLLVVEEMRDAGDRIVEENVEALSADFLPIYAGLDELAVYAPDVARQTRGMVKQAEKHAAGGNKKRAAGVLQEAAAAIAEHTVYLPVSYVEQQVRAALYAVNRPEPDLGAARAAVEHALDSLTTVVDTVVAAPVN